MPISTRNTSNTFTEVTPNEVGRLSVDVMGVKGLDAPKTTFAVVKIGPYWTRLPNVRTRRRRGGDQRLRYPCLSPPARVTVAVFEGTAANCRSSWVEKLQLSTMEDGVRYGGEFQLMTKGADGAVTKTCALECGLQFDYHKGGSLVAAKYMEPLLPEEKWYFAPLKDEEKDKVIKAQKEMMVQRLAQSSPPLAPLASKELLEYAKHEVNIGSIKSSIARIQRLVAGLDKITSFAQYALSWDSIPLTACAQAWIVYLVYYPNMFAPTALPLSRCIRCVCFRGGTNACWTGWWLTSGYRRGCRSRQPPKRRNALERRRRRRRNVWRWRRSSVAARKRRRRRGGGGNRGGEEGTGAHPRRAQKVPPKAAAERAAAEKPKEAFNWDSINPLAALQRQMDEVFAMITLSQTILDEVAGAAERLAGILSWEEPRVTAGFVVPPRARVVAHLRRDGDAILRQGDSGRGAQDGVHRRLAERHQVRRVRRDSLRHATPADFTRRKDEGGAGGKGESRQGSGAREGTGGGGGGRRRRESRAAARAAAAFETVAAAQRLLPHAHAERRGSSEIF